MLKKKKPAKKKKAPTTTEDHNKNCSTSFSPYKLLLVAKTFIKLSSTKQGTDKMREKFWEDIYLHYNELITTSNEINKSNKE